MKVLVLGGSNSVSRAGYVRRLVEVLSRYGQAQVTNLSVGGTTTFSAVARLFDLGEAAATYDLVIYEFALNDNVAFRKRDDGPDLARLAIGTFIKALATTAPQAAVLPVILAKHADFRPDRPSPVYAAQVAFWAELGVPICDVRKGLAHIFAGVCPSWLYSDELHLSAGAAADIAGSIVARSVLQPESRRTAAELLSLIDAEPAFQFDLRYVGAEQLASACEGGAEVVARGNSLMTVKAMRMRSGELRLQGAPLSLSILSDRRHNWVRLREGSAPPFRLSTRLQAVDDPATNPPHLDRFFYSGLCLPTLLGRPIAGAPVPLTLDFPGPEGSGEVLHSASFFCHEPAPLSERYLDLAGVLFAESRAVGLPEPGKSLGKA